MVSPFHFAADDRALVGGSCSFFFVSTKPQHNSEARTQPAPGQRSALVWQPAWLASPSPSQYGLWRQWPGFCSETAEIPALVPGLFFYFLFFKCENEDGPLIILLIFGLGKAALGLQRLTNQPPRIHQTRSFAFRERKCNKTLLPEKGRGKRRRVSIRWFQTHRLTVLSS